MTPRRWGRAWPVVFLGLAMAAGDRARAQFGSLGRTVGYGANPFAGYTGTSALGYNPLGGTGYGYGISNGRIGAGYQAASRFYQPYYPAARPGTTLALQPLYNAITSVPGWYGRTHRARHRLQTRPSVGPIIPRTSFFDDQGKVIWPSTIPSDPTTAELRQAADAAVQAVVREWKSTGHGSVRPVIHAKDQLSAFERKVLPEVRAKNTTDGAALETFFSDLDKSLDAMTYTY
ncbi:MAG TPA: hypothetical protein VFF52_25945 [Isosphaeraceae bacterium]|nr:hypothetical protein [Isosphaeraceae bacterium]